MKIEKTDLDGLYYIKLEPFFDDRGYFVKVYSRNFFEKGNIPITVAEENQSCSRKYVVRGLHFQWDPPLGKLMQIIRGKAFVVAVDINKKSRTFGKWFGKELSDKTHDLIYAPPGKATGFLSLEDSTVVRYSYTAPYNNACESNILWNDPAIGIQWPIPDKPILSERDAKAQTLESWLQRPESDIFT